MAIVIDTISQIKTLQFNNYSTIPNSIYNLYEMNYITQQSNEYNFSY